MCHFKRLAPSSVINGAIEIKFSLLQDIVPISQQISHNAFQKITKVSIDNFRLPISLRMKRTWKFQLGT